jgi:intracellular multiplication protein IcmO
MLKGMMGATLGSSVEGDTDLALENKPTRSSTPFMAIFDEVGYYTTQGMAVMAAQARSLGFSLVFAGQDIPALEKRVKEEARSILANCNIKIFGKLEDPTQTKEFFEKTIGEATVIEASTRKEVGAMFGVKKVDKSDSFNVTSRAKASYSQLKNFIEGQAIVSFGNSVVQARMFYSDPGKIKSLRVNKFVPLPQADPDGKLSSKDVDAILERLRDPKWTADKSTRKTESPDPIRIVAEQFNAAAKKKRDLVEAGCIALTLFAREQGLLKAPDPRKEPIVETPKEKELTAKELPAAAATTTEEKPLVAVREPEVKAPAPPKPVSVPPPPKTPVKEDSSAPEAGTEETLSWSSLVGGDEDTAKPKSAVPEIKKEDLPDTSETMSWKDLVGGGSSGSSTTSAKNEMTRKPMPTMPQGAGLGSGFGISGYGTGFGGIGSLGMPPAAPKPVEKTPDLTEKAVEETADDSETMSWKDLIK